MAPKPAIKMEVINFFMFLLSFVSRATAGCLLSCLIANTILSQQAESKKPTVGFWYAFFAKKCVFHRFLGPPQNSGLQSARRQPFANEPINAPSI